MNFKTNSETVIVVGSEMAIRVLILNGVVGVSLHDNAIQKGMNLSVLPYLLVNSWADWFFGKVISLRERKFWT